MADAERVLREAFQRVDELSKVMGMKSRPEWGQPFHDVWQDHLRAVNKAGALEEANAALRKRIAELEAANG